MNVQHSQQQKAATAATLNTWHDPELGRACIIGVQVEAADGPLSYFLYPQTAYTLQAEDGDWFAVDSRGHRYRLEMVNGGSVTRLPTHQDEQRLDRSRTYDLIPGSGRTPQWLLLEVSGAPGGRAEHQEEGGRDDRQAS